MARITILIAMVFAFACGGPDGVGNDGEVVGGACIDERDCTQKCQRGGDFPDGTCTVACNNDGDCPNDTFCINRDGGICLLGCGRPSDCRPGYSCEGEENRGHGGDSLVCIH